MGGKGKTKRQVYDYFMSMSYGACLGPVDSINAVTIKDKDAWVGPVQTSGKVEVNQGDLFGGDDGEGGPVGWIEFYMGEYGQTMSGDLASRHGLTPETAPGYSGIAHVFFRGSVTRPPDGDEDNGGVFGPVLSIISRLFSGAVEPDDRSGFMWTSNNPYLPSASIHATRGPKGLSRSLIYPIIGLNDEGEELTAGLDGLYGNGDEGEPAGPEPTFFDILSSLFRQGGIDDIFSTPTEGVREMDRTRMPDANPAAMIYECMVDADWGKGELEAAMDKASYEACAEVLEREFFGLTMLYTRQDTIENYVSEIIDHILGVQYQDPETGLWTMKLIRDDYDVSSLITLNPANCTVDDLKVRGWGETINEIKVSYTDPVSREDETVSAQNLSNIAIQGGVISDSRDYHGIRNPWLAKIVAERDVASASRPLITATITADRTARVLRPASVFLLDWPEEEIVAMPMRVMSIDYGTSKNREIVIEATEDVFGSSGVFTVPTQEPVVDYSVDPLPKNPDQLFLMTPPLPPLISAGLDVDELEANYPQSDVMFLVDDTAVDFENTLVTVIAPLPTGASGVQTVATAPAAYSRGLTVPLVREARSVIPARVIDNLTRNNAEIGDVFILGSSEDLHELVMLDSYDAATLEWTVLRGMYDTIPLAWDEETRLWILPLTEAVLDNREILAGDTQTYRFQPRTRRGRLPREDAPDVVFTPSERLYQPFRPADPTVDGLRFVGPTFEGLTLSDTITLTWKLRNRLAEDSIAYEWDRVGTTPEVGQTTTIRFRDSIDRVSEYEVADLVGSTTDIDITSLATYRFYDVEFLAVRDGIESFRPSYVTIELVRLGYGNNYGFDYGENDD